MVLGTEGTICFIEVSTSLVFMQPLTNSPIEVRDMLISTVCSPYCVETSRVAGREEGGR